MLVALLLVSEPVVPLLVAVESVVEPDTEPEAEVEPDTLMFVLLLVLSGAVVVVALDAAVSVSVELVAADDEVSVSLLVVLLFTSPEQPALNPSTAANAVAPIKLSLFFFMLTASHHGCENSPPFIRGLTSAQTWVAKLMCLPPSPESSVG